MGRFRSGSVIELRKMTARSRSVTVVLAKPGPPIVNRLSSVMATAIAAISCSPPKAESRWHAAEDHPVAVLQITPANQTARAVEVDAGEASGAVLETEGEAELVDEFEYIPEIDFRYPSIDML
jgi:hypothetical protein